MFTYAKDNHGYQLFYMYFKKCFIRILKISIVYIIYIERYCASIWEKWMCVWIMSTVCLEFVHNITEKYIFNVHLKECSTCVQKNFKVYLKNVQCVSKKCAKCIQKMFNLYD